VTGPGNVYTANVITTNPAWFSGVNPIGTDTANWITANSTGNPNGALNALGGVYIYTYTPGLSGPVTVSGNWAADNCGTISSTALRLPEPASPSAAESALQWREQQFPIDHGVSVTIAGAGPHTLAFEVFNEANSPTGLLVDTGSLGQVPEPASIVLTLSGLGLVGLGIRRRKAVK